MLQTGKESYDSNAQQRQNYVTDTLLPYVVQWEQEDGYKAIPPDKRDRMAGTCGATWRCSSGATT